MTSKAKNHSTDVSTHTHALHKCTFGQNLINYPQPKKHNLTLVGKISLKNSDRELVGRDKDKGSWEDVAQSYYTCKKL